MGTNGLAPMAGMSLLSGPLALPLLQWPSIAFAHIFQYLLDEPDFFLGLVVHNLHLDKCCGESKRLLGEWMDFSFLLLRRRISYSNLLAAEFAEDYNCAQKV